VSLDVEVYAVRNVSLADLRPSLPKSDVWGEYDGELSYDGGGWQVLVTEPEQVDADDVPSDLAALLPDATYLIALTLEPIGADPAGQEFLRRVVDAVGSAVGGVSYDFESGAPRRFSD
jgi:hypothetical protein